MNQTTIHTAVNDSFDFKESFQTGLRGELIFGHDLKNVNGVSQLGEVLFRKKNMIVLGGIQDVFYNMWHVTKNGVKIPTFYDMMQVGLPNTTPSQITYETPYGPKQVIYEYGREVFGFVIGITGTVENTITEYPVNYRENSITMEKHFTDGSYLDGIQIPFRFTSATLTNTDQKKYFGKKTFSDGRTAYYFKTFEQLPQIKHIWKSSNMIETDDEDAEEILATDTDIWNLERPDQCSSCVEMLLRIKSKDMKEWFLANDQADTTRFNCIGLVSGRYNPEYDDYEDVTLTTKLNIPLEPMKSNKDYWGIYRVYGH